MRYQHTSIKMAASSSHDSHRLYYCETEKECWRVLARLCHLSRSDCQAILAMEYSNMKRLSMLATLFSAAEAVTSLMDHAGVSHAKAHIVVLFATYLLHHKQLVPADLELQDLLDFALQLKQQQPAAVPSVQASPTRRGKHTRSSTASLRLSQLQHVEEERHMSMDSSMNVSSLPNLHKPPNRNPSCLLEHPSSSSCLDNSFASDSLVFHPGQSSDHNMIAQSHHTAPASLHGSIGPTPYHNSSTSRGVDMLPSKAHSTHLIHNNPNANTLLRNNSLTQVQLEEKERRRQRRRRSQHPTAAMPVTPYPQSLNKSCRSSATATTVGMMSLNSLHASAPNTIGSSRWEPCHSRRGSMDISSRTKSPTRSPEVSSPTGTPTMTGNKTLRSSSTTTGTLLPPTAAADTTVLHDSLNTTAMTDTSDHQHHQKITNNCNRPRRRPSFGSGEELRNTLHSNTPPPQCMVQRSVHRWTLALDSEDTSGELDLSDVTDSEEDSDSDSDGSESTSSTEEYDSDDEDEDSEEDDEEEEKQECTCASKSPEEGGAPAKDTSDKSDLNHHRDSCHIHGSKLDKHNKMILPPRYPPRRRRSSNKKIVAPEPAATTSSGGVVANCHEWTLPANQVLPINLQSLFREAMHCPGQDLQAKIQEAMNGQ